MDNLIKLESLSKKHWIPWLVLVAGLLITAWVGIAVKLDIENDARRKFALDCNEVVAKIQSRLESHKQVLLGAAALFDASRSVERDEWRDYARRMQIDTHFNGIQGLGFTLLVPPAGLERHVAEMRRQGISDFNVWPGGTRSLYTSIVYLEPHAGRNLRAIGYDMYSEPVRRAAMEQARDRNEAALSGKVTLVQETGEDVQAGTLMYMPVYRKGMPVDTVEQRRTALIGWVYSPFRMHDLFQGVLSDEAARLGGHVRLLAYDGRDENEANLLYASHPAQPSDRISERLLEIKKRIDFNGHEWTVSFDLAEGESGFVDYGKAWWVVAGGLIISVLLYLLINSIQGTWRNALRIANDLTSELRTRGDAERSLNLRLESQEHAIEQAHQRLELALMGGDLGLWDWNVPSGSVVFNQRWCEMLGYGLDEVEQNVSSWKRLVHPDDWQAINGPLLAHMKGEIPSYESEHRMRHRDGHWVWILDRGKVMERNAQGEPVRMVGTHLDISERKNSEQTRLQRAEEQRNVLVREVHHRIKNNLQGIIGLLELEMPQNSAAGELIGKTIGKLKSISVVFGLQGKHNENEVYLGEVLSELCNVARSFSDTEIALSARPEFTNSIRLDSEDAVAVALVINELLTNSVKHNCDGAVSVLLEDADTAVVLRIANNYREDGKSLDWEQGVGLGGGLSLVRALLPQNGAQLSLSRQAGSMTAILKLSPPIFSRKQEKNGEETTGS